MERKKQLIIFVLRILESETDSQHPLTQTKISNIISKVYPCDRKTVCRNIGFLKEMGYPIMKTTKGFYMEHKTFTVDEIKFVRDALMSSSNDNIQEKNDLAGRVVNFLTSRYSINN